jgi:hypothetical protein
MFPSIQGEIPFLDDTSNYSNTCELPHFFPHIINRKWPKKKLYFSTPIIPDSQKMKVPCHAKIPDLQLGVEHLTW